MAHSPAYSTVWEWVRESGYDSFSEIPRDELDGADCKAKSLDKRGRKIEVYSYLLVVMI